MFPVTVASALPRARGISKADIVIYCEACGLPLKTHEKCDCCGRLVGNEHEETSITRVVLDGKKLCQMCSMDWRKGERKHCYSTWEEFTEGNKAM